MNEIKRTVALIKKTKDQPVIFHVLHSHLAYVVNTKKAVATEAMDLWGRILLASVEDLKMPRNSLETRILQYLKGSRQKTDEDVFKLKIILYYMDSRSLSSQNMFILFELINYHYNSSLLTDLLIDTILTRSFLSKAFNIKSTKRLSNDAAMLFLKRNNTFSYKRLPTYIYFDIEPPLVEYGNKSLLMRLKILESLGIYANYTKNVEYFKNILPQTEDFLDLFKKFVCKDPKLFLDRKIVFDISKLQLVNINLIENLKTKIREAFIESKDRLELKADIIQFINSIEN